MRVAVLSFSGLLVCAVCAAQSPRQRLLDSLANPVLSSLGEAMVFEADTVDAGTIAEDGGSRTYVFRWRNSGSGPVTVLNVSTTCDCVVPRWERVPVAPGETGSLTVVYRPKGHPGRFSRRIFLYTGQERPSKVLVLKGEVTPAALPLWEFPCEMGDLRLKRDSVAFAGDSRAVERILGLNVGERTLRISAEAMLLPEGLSVRCEPEKVEPGGRCEIVIVFDPSGFSGRSVTVPVVLKGLPLPPSRRTVKVAVGGACGSE